MAIKTVTVLGANGTMGCNVAGIFASFGNARVYLVSRNIEASVAAVERAGKSVRADAIASNLIPADYSMLEKCLGESDLVFESVSENMEIKLGVLGKLGDLVRPDALVCVGTSGLPVNRLAQVLPESVRPRFMGMHFFNPPYAMRLCELTPSESVSPALVDEVERYLKDTLCRIVVRCADTPAFLGNRIGFELINRAMQLAAEKADKGGIDYIDAVMGPFSGRAMAPLNTADFVGLDVHKAIMDNLYENAPDDPMRDAFALPTFCGGLVERGLLGRKAKGMGGLYRLDRHEDGTKTRMTFDVATGEFRPTARYTLPFADAAVAMLRVGDYENAMKAIVNDGSEDAALCLGLMSEYIVYSLYISREVSDSPHAADDVMAAGFNWCPPLAMAEALSLAGDVAAIVKGAIPPERVKGIDIDSLMADVPRSKYDFRRYFRAAR